MLILSWRLSDVKYRWLEVKSPKFQWNLHPDWCTQTYQCPSSSHEYDWLRCFVLLQILECEFYLLELMVSSLIVILHWFYVAKICCLLHMGNGDLVLFFLLWLAVVLCGLRRRKSFSAPAAWDHLTGNTRDRGWGFLNIPLYGQCCLGISCVSL